METRRNQREIDNSFKEEMDALEEELGKNRFGYRDVLLDLSIEKEMQHQAKLRTSTLPNGKAKANTYYQKVFYYQEEEQSKIEEVWIEHLDYEKALKHTEVIAEGIAAGAHQPPPPVEKVKELLQFFKQAETSDEFNVEAAFETFLGEYLGPEEIESAIPGFFTTLVQIDPDVLEEKPSLDVPLRESLRVISDWLAYDGRAMKATLARNLPQTIKEIDRAPAHPVAK